MTDRHMQPDKKCYIDAFSNIHSQIFMFFFTNRCTPISVQNMYKYVDSALHKKTSRQTYRFVMLS